MASCIEALLLSVLGLRLALCCSEYGNELQPINWRAQRAEAIVYAEAVHTYLRTGKRDYTTEFRLICSLKNEDAIATATKKNSQEETILFNVTRMGFHPGWCMKVEAKVGQVYFIFIRLEEIGDEHVEKARKVFVPDLVNSQTPIMTDTLQHRVGLEEFLEGDHCNLPKLPASTYDPISLVTTGTEKQHLSEEEEEKENEILDVTMKPGDSSSFVLATESTVQMSSTSPKPLGTRETKVRLGRGPVIYPTTPSVGKTTSGSLATIKTNLFLSVLFAGTLSYGLLH